MRSSLAGRSECEFIDVFHFQHPSSYGSLLANFQSARFALDAAIVEISVSRKLFGYYDTGGNFYIL